MQSKLPYFFEIMTAALVAGSLFQPFASAIGLLIIFSAKIAEKYFTRNISDSDRRDIQSIKAEQIEIKLKVEREGLAKAFTR